LTSSRASALAIAVATSPANRSIRRSVSRGSRSLLPVAAISVPHSRPATTIGVATAERTPSPVAIAEISPVASAQSSARAARPVRCTSAITFSPSRARLVPTGGGSHGVSDCARSVAVPSRSKRSSPTALWPRTRHASAVTALKTSAADDSCATSSATCRSAACSSASPEACSRASVLATAVASSSVNSVSRRSAVAESGRCSDTAAIAPHSSPSTTTEPRRSVTRVPGSWGPPTSPSTVAVPSASNRMIAETSEPKRSPTSAATAPNTPSAEVPRATRVARRRSASRPSVSRSISRASTLTAVFIGSVLIAASIRSTRGSPIGTRVAPVVNPGLTPGHPSDVGLAPPPVWRSGT
jgi:hypothetical protein